MGRHSERAFCLLRERREGRMAAEAVARAAGCSLNAIREIENNRQVPNVMLAIRIARAVGATCEELWRPVESGGGR